MDRKHWSCVSIGFLLIAVIIFSSTSLQAEIQKPAVPGKTVHQEIRHGGITRDYYIHLPKRYNDDRKWPVVFVLHGGTGNALVTVKRLAPDYLSFADSEGFIAVYPNGTLDRPGGRKRHWNDGRENTWFAAGKKNIDDVGFISRLVDRFVEQYHADPDRIYVTGASNGGMMSYRLAMDLSDKITAVAALIANLPTDLAKKTPKHAVSVLIMNGTDDPLMPYKGGEIRFGPRVLGNVISTDETFKFWVKANNLSGEAKTKMMPDIDPDDETRVKITRSKPNEHGVEVVLYTIEGGGHTYPGGVQYLPVHLIGKVSGDINGAEVVWNFFKTKRKSRP